VNIPASYQPEPIDPATLAGWLGWSLPFFSAPVLQNPHIDLTLQLDVTDAFARYQHDQRDSVAGTKPVSFFAFLVWHLAQTLAQHPSFNLRCVDGQWLRLRNPPIFIPVAVGGELRFRDLVLENVYQQDYPAFLANYRTLLALARSPEGAPPLASDAFCLAHFMGNLPNLRFSGLTLHWRADQMIGQSSFYFGQRYDEGGRKLIPLAVRMHHSCTDPFVLNELIADFQRRFMP
jgi:chloramphenicol O-acetyltransferase